MFALMGLLVCVLAGCAVRTTVDGQVVDEKGTPLPGVKVSLQHSAKLKTDGVTDAKGKFRLILKERCFLICAGGNPSLLAGKRGFMRLHTYAHWDKTTTRKLVLKKMSKRPTSRPFLRPSKRPTSRPSKRKP